MNIDDAISVVIETSESATVCSEFVGTFDDARNLTIRFTRETITVKPDGSVVHTTIPGAIKTTLKNPERQIVLLNRRTFQPTENTMKVSRLVQAIVSLFVEELTAHTAAVNRNKQLAQQAQQLAAQETHDNPG